MLIKKIKNLNGKLRVLRDLKLRKYKNQVILKDFERTYELCLPNTCFRNL